MQTLPLCRCFCGSRNEDQLEVNRVLDAFGYEEQPHGSVPSSLLAFSAAPEQELRGAPLREGSLLLLSAEEDVTLVQLSLYVNGFAFVHMGQEHAFVFPPFTLVRNCKFNATTTSGVCLADLKCFKISLFTHSSCFYFGVEGAERAAEELRSRWVVDISRAIRLVTQSLFPPFHIVCDPLYSVDLTTRRLMAGYLVYHDGPAVASVPYCELHPQHDHHGKVIMYETEACQVVVLEIMLTEHTTCCEKVGINCSCFSIESHLFAARTLAERKLWLRAISNIKVKLQNAAPSPTAQELGCYRAAIKEHLEESRTAMHAGARASDPAEPLLERRGALSGETPLQRPARGTEAGVDALGPSSPTQRGDGPGATQPCTDVAEEGVRAALLDGAAAADAAAVPAVAAADEAAGVAFVAEARHAEGEAAGPGIGKVAKPCSPRRPALDVARLDAQAGFAIPTPRGDHSPQRASDAAPGVASYCALTDRPLHGVPIREGGVWLLSADEEAVLVNFALYANGFTFVSDGREHSFSVSPFTLVRNCKFHTPTGSGVDLTDFKCFKVSLFTHGVCFYFGIWAASEAREREAEDMRSRWVVDISRAVRLVTQSLFPPFQVSCQPLPHVPSTRKRLMGGYLAHHEDAAVFSVLYCELHPQDELFGKLLFYESETCQACLFELRVTELTTCCEKIGISCSCFSVDDHLFSARSLAERRLWLRAISNIKVKLQNRAPCPTDAELAAYRVAIEEHLWQSKALLPARASLEPLLEPHPPPRCAPARLSDAAVAPADDIDESCEASPPRHPEHAEEMTGSRPTDAAAPMANRAASRRPSFGATPEAAADARFLGPRNAGEGDADGAACAVRRTPSGAHGSSPRVVHLLVQDAEAAFGGDVAAAGGAEPLREDVGDGTRGGVAGDVGDEVGGELGDDFGGGAAGDAGGEVGGHCSGGSLMGISTTVIGEAI